MKFTGALLTLLIATSANATKTQELECFFTEPFLTLTIDLEGKSVTQTEPDWDNDASQTKTTTIATGIKITVDSSDPFLPKYTVKKASGEMIVELVLNMKGSDAMSEITYPFDAKYALPDYDNLWGGCTSDKIAWINPYED